MMRDGSDVLTAYILTIASAGRLGHPGSSRAAA